MLRILSFLGAFCGTVLFAEPMIPALLSIDKYQSLEGNPRVFEAGNAFQLGVFLSDRYEHVFQWHQTRPFSAIIRSTGKPIDQGMIDQILADNGGKDYWRLDYETVLPEPEGVFKGWLNDNHQLSLEVIENAEGEILSIELKDLSVWAHASTYSSLETN